MERGASSSCSSVPGVISNDDQRYLFCCQSRMAFCHWRCAVSLFFFLDASRMSRMTKASKTLGLLESQRLRLQFPFGWLSALWESESLSLCFKWLELNRHSCLQLLMSNLLTRVRWWGFFPVKPSAWICSHLPLFLSGPCWISVRRLKIAWLYSHRHFSSFFIFFSLSPLVLHSATSTPTQSFLWIGSPKPRLSSELPRS